MTPEDRRDIVDGALAGDQRFGRAPLNRPREQPQHIIFDSVNEDAPAPETKRNRIEPTRLSGLILPSTFGERQPTAPVDDDEPGESTEERPSRLDGPRDRFASGRRRRPGLRRK